MVVISTKVLVFEACPRILLCTVEVELIETWAILKGIGREIGFETSAIVVLCSVVLCVTVQFRWLSDWPATFCIGLTVLQAGFVATRTWCFVSGPSRRKSLACDVTLLGLSTWLAFALL